ncbi:MAG: PorV/PorQ family protein [Candidatus Cloacimonetes bacterium]|nr:PorV/PorQ family protein [Candidatus Cloacimonadota bacterium]
MKKVIIFLMIIAIVSCLAAIDKDAGSKGYLFLKLPVSPAVAGMGGTGEMLSSSPLTLLHHPAALDWNRGHKLAFSHTNWLVDTNMYNVAWRNVQFQQAYGLGLTYFDYGKLDKRLDNGTWIGEYYPMDMRLAGNYVRQITPTLYAGANLNIIYEKIDTSSSTALTTDLGVSYQPPYSSVFDLAFKNIGFSSKMDMEKTELPLVVELGVTSFNSIDITINEKSLVMPLCYKLAYMDDHNNLIHSVGVEMNLQDMLYLRTGYKFNYNEENISAGLGVKYQNISIDYTFLNNKIEAVHLIGLGFEL